MDVPQPLRALSELLTAAREGGDGSVIAALYAVDGMMLLPDGERVCGREAIAAHYQQHERAPRPASRRTTPSAAPTRYYFFPPIAHAVTTINGRHGEKHSLIDVFMRQHDGTYLLVLSSWTLP